MIAEDNSPDPDITIRSPRLSMPRFNGIPLPSPLRELQRRQEPVTRSAATPHPSEFTALAVRLRKIHLDSSPSSDKSNASPYAKPTKLQFEGEEDQLTDKENIHIADEVTKAGTQLNVSSNTQSKEENRIDALVFSDTSGSKDAQDAAAELSASEISHQGSEQLSERKDAEDPHADSESSPAHAPVANPEARLTGPLQTNDEGPSLEANDSNMTRGVTRARRSSRIVAAVAEHSTAPALVTSANTPTIADLFTEGPNKNNFDAARNTSDLFNSPSQNVQEADRYLHTVLHHKITPHDGNVDSGEGDQKESETVHEDQGHSADPTVGRDASPPEITESPAQDADPFLEEFKACLNIITEGHAKWSWQKRCEATARVTEILSTSPSNEIRSIIRMLLPTLSTTINNSLDELRPSIMASALNLVNAIVGSKADFDSDFAEQVFPSIMDLACGRSITSQEGARCLALVLDFHPKLSKILEEADNPDRLTELLNSDEHSELVADDVKSRAKKASILFRQALGMGDSSVNEENITKPAVEHLEGDGAESSQKPQQQPSLNRNPAMNLSNAETPSQPNRNRNARFSQRLNAVTSTPLAVTDGSTPKSGGLARRSLQLLSSGLKSTPRHSMRLGSEGHPAAPVVRNMKLGDSVRKISPGSRKKRIYSEEDMEEARRAAMRVVMEEASQTHAKEREKLQNEKADLEKKLAKEKSDVADLKIVLEEFELTMQKMVAQGNTQASAYCATLEKETKKLKAELLEVTEAYENIKERYDAAKQTLKVYENKENRSIEQIRELKKNMAELQKWSNDLKANSEKKLAKAFQNVTSYRASFLDMEAHLSKANSDLERTQADLAKEAASHATTAAALSRVETSLHSEQDTRSSLEASLSTSKASLSRLTSQKERLQKELSEAQEELKQMSSELSRLKDADVRAKNASKQLENYAGERQSLKARAYDDMNRIRELECLLESKDKEYNELNAICEEALSQLENLKQYN